MRALAIAISVGLLFTAVFAFRFAHWRRPGLLIAYFTGFVALEWTADHFWLPRDVLPIELAYVCVALFVVFVAASFVRRKLEDAEVPREP